MNNNVMLFVVLNNECKRVHLLYCDPDCNPDRNPDHDQIVSCKWGNRQKQNLLAAISPQSCWS